MSSGDGRPGPNGFDEYKRLLLETDQRHERRLDDLTTKVDVQHVETINRIADLAACMEGLKGEARASGGKVGGVVGGGVAGGVVALWQVIKALASGS